MNAKNIWYVNSGCSRNIIREKNLLVDFFETKGMKASFVEEKGSQITGLGKVTNAKLTLDKVNFVK